MNLSAVHRTYICRPPSLSKGAGAFQVVSRGRSNFRERGGSTSPGALPSGAASPIVARAGGAAGAGRRMARLREPSQSRDCFLEKYAFPYLISSPLGRCSRARTERGVSLAGQQAGFSELRCLPLFLVRARMTILNTSSGNPRCGAFAPSHPTVRASRRHALHR